LGLLEEAMHDDDRSDRHLRDTAWLMRHAAPWVLRRVRGRTAGDGLGPKHAELTRVPSDPGIRGVRVG
jgi:phosphatidylinositol alpha 1,6-mannosyltransferase